MSNHCNEARLEQLYEQFKNEGLSDERAYYLAIETFTNEMENPDANTDR